MKRTAPSHEATRLPRRTRSILRRVLYWSGILTLAAVVPAAMQAPSVPGSAGALGPEIAPGGGDSDLTSANPVLFVTQVPIPNPGDYRTVVSTFSNHDGGSQYCGRGGDLYIIYPDGTLRNLTREAGFGIDGIQVGPNAISVREPCVHWSGTKALFSMVVGAPVQGDDQSVYYWQVYEVTGLKKGETAVITKVAQPTNSNNVSPCYASDGRILLTSDRTRTGAPHLYPQLDEYESVPTTTGIWSLDPATGGGFQMNHTPSGAYKPLVDSYGRVVFTRWDHLERDQQKDQSNYSDTDSIDYGTFNYSDESAFAYDTGNDFEVFPEASKFWTDFLNGDPGYSGDLNGYDPKLTGNTFNLFFPWTLNQDGTGEETLNHIGRHELRPYSVVRVRSDDPSVIGGIPYPWTKNKTYIKNAFQFRELPYFRGWYLFVDAEEFFTFGAGQIVLIHARPGLTANQMNVFAVTHPDTQTFDRGTPSPDHTGFYRTPTLLTDGQLIASHTAETLPTYDPNANFDFRLVRLDFDGSYYRAGPSLTGGLVKNVTYYDPYNRVDYNGPLWELDPVEVVARPVPPDTKEAALPGPELQSLSEEGVDLAELKAFLEENDLALVVSRNLTTRDRNDRQQPFNLKVAGSNTQTTGDGGMVYDVAYLQLFQGDQIRGLTGGGTLPIPGRRVLAQFLHDPGTLNPPAFPNGPPGSVSIAADGSAAALVPARRATSWQLVDPMGEAVVRERYWVSFQPGEIRTCGSCHGLNDLDQALRPPPTNKPQALNLMLQHLKSIGAL